MNMRQGSQALTKGELWYTNNGSDIFFVTEVRSWPQMTEYVNAYTFSAQPFNWPFVLVGLVPVLVAGLLIAGKYRRNWTQPNLVAAIVCGGLSLIVLISTLPILKSEAEAASALRDGTFSFVEGTVTDFHPMPYNGHDEECFSVQQQRFCYSDYAVTTGFHNSASHGGPIRPGLSVRVAYLRSMILRLDIAKD
jgi:hypothetical protein